MSTIQPVCEALRDVADLGSGRRRVSPTERRSERFGRLVASDRVAVERAIHHVGDFSRDLLPAGEPRVVEPSYFLAPDFLAHRAFRGARK
jgi:hypothetical protein